MTMIKTKDWLQVIPGKSAPDYVKKMQAILEEAWGDSDKMKALKDDPTSVFKAKGLLSPTSPVVVYAHPDDVNVFHIAIPKRDPARDPTDRLLLASEVIRCCAEC